MKWRVLLRLLVPAGLAPLAWSASCAGTVTEGVRAAGAGGGASSTASSASSTASSTHAAATGAGGGDGGIALASPPPPGPPHAPDGTATFTFAVTRLHFGDADPDGTPDPANGWKHWGYNIDGVPPGDLGAMCKPRNGAPAAHAHEEGLGGIENAFGRDILPILLGISSTWSASVDQALAAGAPTVLISLHDLGAAASYDPLPSQIAAGAALMAPPHLDGTDLWPVVQGSPVQLPQSYLTAGTWVSSPALSLTITLPLLPKGAQMLSMALEIHHAIVSMKLDPSHPTATSGIISGVIPTDAFIAQINMLAYEFDPSLCWGGSGVSITAQLEQASDILQDGTQDPTEECDGISIGLGFDAAAVQLGPLVPPPPPPPDPCADGG